MARATRAVVCGESAPALHQLIDDIPAAGHIAVPRGSRRPTSSTACSPSTTENSPRH
ncbi:hypothetical protein [Streptomyces sp900129855]|uniref:Uncharacterized protein n=1 Tax=Streptomyces sp. 900129855 TaxID=3155129 RepID=A0ABV2ZMY4_9ACTN